MYSIENFYSREKDMDLFVTMPKVVIDVVQSNYVMRKTLYHMDKLIDFEHITSIVSRHTMDFINHHEFSQRFD